MQCAGLADFCHARIARAKPTSESMSRSPSEDMLTSFSWLSIELNVEQDDEGRREVTKCAQSESVPTGPKSVLI